jgi:hypothetical protein
MMDWRESFIKLNGLVCGRVQGGSHRSASASFAG